MPHPRRHRKTAKLWAVPGSLPRESLCLLVGPAAERATGLHLSKNSPNGLSETLPFGEHLHINLRICEEHICSLASNREGSKRPSSWLAANTAQTQGKNVGARGAPRGHSQSQLISQWILNHFFHYHLP